MFVKSAVIKGKILNLMFLDINIPVLPIEILVTSNSETVTNNSQSRFSLIIPPYFKDRIVTKKARMRL